MRYIAPALLLVALTSQLCSACGEPRLTHDEQIPKTFIYDPGWTIPGLSGAKLLRTYIDETGSEVIDYEPTKKTLVDLQGFSLSGDSKSLRLTPGYVQLVIGILEFRVKNKTYAYDVITESLREAEPPMWQQVEAPISPGPTNKNKMIGGILGCGRTVLRYFDTDGDGRFESLEYEGFGGPRSNSTRCPTTPEWALKLLPNRASAEFCTKQMEPPEAIKNILNYRPAIPRFLPTAK